MSFETGTKNYGLPQYKGSDKPSWQTDITNAFEKIDDVLGSVSDSAGTSSTEIVTIKGDITTLKEQTSTNAANLSNLQTQVNTNNANLQNEINALDVRVATNKTVNDNQTQAISSLQEQINAIPDISEIGTLTQDVSELKRLVGDSNIGVSKTLTGVVGDDDISEIGEGTLTSAVNSLQSDFGGMKFGVDANGNYGYYKAGADTVTPFKSGFTISSLNVGGKTSTLDAGNDGRATTTITIDVSKYSKINFGDYTAVYGGASAISSITADGTIIVNKQYITNESIDVSNYNTVTINLTTNIALGTVPAGTTFGFGLNNITFS